MSGSPFQGQCLKRLNLTYSTPVSSLASCSAVDTVVLKDRQVFRCRSTVKSACMALPHLLAGTVYFDVLSARDEANIEYCASWDIHSQGHLQRFKCLKSSRNLIWCERALQESVFWTSLYLKRASKSFLSVIADLWCFLCLEFVWLYQLFTNVVKC